MMCFVLLFDMSKPEKNQGKVFMSATVILINTHTNILPLLGQGIHACTFFNKP